MSATRGDDTVGYRRPPKATQWRQGQSGNPKGRRKRGSLDIVGFIDRKLAEPIDIVENGASRRMSILEAILLRLWAKEMAGSKRAAAVRMKFQELIPPSTKPREIIIRELDCD
jgi:hypothetical protein